MEDSPSRQPSVSPSNVGCEDFSSSSSAQDSPTAQMDVCYHLIDMPSNIKESFCEPLISRSSSPKPAVDPVYPLQPPNWLNQLDLTLAMESLSYLNPVHRYTEEELAQFFVSTVPNYAMTETVVEGESYGTSPAWWTPADLELSKHIIKVHEVTPESPMPLSPVFSDIELSEFVDVSACSSSSFLFSPSPPWSNHTYSPSSSGYSSPSPSNSSFSSSDSLQYPLSPSLEPMKRATYLTGMSPSLEPVLGSNAHLPEASTANFSFEEWLKFLEQCQSS